MKKEKKEEEMNGKDREGRRKCKRGERWSGGGEEEEE